MPDAGLPCSLWQFALTNTEQIQSQTANGTYDRLDMTDVDVFWLNGWMDIV